MTKLATFAAHFDEVRARGSYVVDGRFETLDGGGHTSSVKAVLARVEPAGTSHRLVVLRYTEDGRDMTPDAQRRARDAAARPKDKNDLSISLPVAAQQQARYAFDEVERDQVDPSRVRIAFVPKVLDDHSIEGSAWVDTRTGAVVSAGFKLSKTPFLVDFVHITVEFGARTPLGPAVSSISVRGQGGLLFFRRGFRAVATLSGYTL
ncbi:MAG: hypothetical protein ABSC94_10405 [Polyangiaceae bacterium]